MCTRNTPSLALSRQALRAAMARTGHWSPDAVFNAELALLELISNAWSHGATPSPVIVLTLHPRTLHVSVSDECDALPQPRTTTHPSLAENGRGLQLVEGLTDRWGVDPQLRGKSVWYELDSDA
ncbi:ATP-binding protein [Kitasatospora sp. NPDC089797]|uniref:ATP-binding protein n=1 Tax=Kitasatospora sp. NPDC089797 TaxID=3155298 RepID=UPI0034442238